MKDSQKKNDSLEELVFPISSNGAGGHRKFFQALDPRVIEALLSMH